MKKLLQLTDTYTHTSLLREVGFIRKFYALLLIMTLLGGLAVGHRYYGDPILSAVKRDATDPEGMVEASYSKTGTSADPCTEPVITTQPLSQTMATSGSASFTVEATGDDLTYQWQFLYTDGNYYDMVPGDQFINPNSATMTIANYGDNLAGFKYRCVVKSGECSIATDLADLTIGCSNPVITIQPTAQSIGPGTSANFSVVATGENLTYQWKFQDADGNSYDMVSGDQFLNPDAATMTVTNYADNLAGLSYFCVVSSADCNVISEIASLTFCTVSTGTPISTAYDGGNTALLSITAGIDATSFQWQQSTDGGFTFADIADSDVYNNAATAEMTVYGVSESMANFQYRCVVGDGSCFTNSAPVALTVCVTPANPENQLIGIGTDASFSTSLAGDHVSYKWFVGFEGNWTELSDGGVYSNTTTATLNITGAPEELNDHYYRCETQTGDCIKTTVEARLTVCALPVIIIQPVSQFLAEDGSASFTVEATGENLTYQWKYVDSNGDAYDMIEGDQFVNPNAATMTIANYNDGLNGLSYFCVVSTGSCAISTETVTLSYPPCTDPAITLQPISQNVAINRSAAYTVEATGSNLTFQWKYVDGDGNVNNLSDGEQFIGTQAATLSIVNIGDNLTGLTYFCQVSSRECSVSSEVVSLIFCAPHIDGAWSVSAEEGGDATFNISASEDATSFQWQESTDGGVTFTDISDGGIYSSVTTAAINLTGVPISMGNYQYRCVVGNGTCYLNSYSAVLSVCNSPQYLNDKRVNPGTDVSFTAAVTGENITYKWYVGIEGNWSEITDNDVYSNATSATLNITGATESMTDYWFRCETSNGTCVRTTNEAKLTVCYAPDILSQTGSQNVELGQTGLFSLELSDENGATFQWQESFDGNSWSDLTDGEIASGSNSSALSVNYGPYALTRYFRCVINRGACEIMSNSVKFVVCHSPVINSQPLNQFAFVGKVAKFSVDYETYYNYSWKVDKGNGEIEILSDNATYSGVGNSVLVISSVTPEMEGYLYSCDVSDAGCVTSSQWAALAICPVTITTQPADQESEPGANATFTIVSSMEGAGYEWQVDDGNGFVSIVDDAVNSHANTSELTITGVTTAMNSNVYRCIVTNGPCNEISEGATLNIGGSITLTGSSGIPATYSSLTRNGGLFEALNGTPQSGDLVVHINANVKNENGDHALNAGIWNTLSITPTGSFVISGAIAANKPLISLNGADHVTIDGLNADDKSLTFSNSTVSNTIGTNTIRFINGATHNTITNTTILGSGARGVVYLADDKMSASGNDNNTVSNSNIGPAGDNLPTFGIASEGENDAAHYNSGNVFRDNNIYDYFNGSNESAGIYVGGGTTDNTISGNKFYQTMGREANSSARHSAISVNPENAEGRFEITGNTIGYSDASGNGIYSLSFGLGNRFVPIYLKVGSDESTSVQGNIIAGIEMRGHMKDTNGPTFAGIYVEAGKADVGNLAGNQIGSLENQGSITYSSDTDSPNTLYGIYHGVSSSGLTANNQVGGVSAEIREATPEATANILGIFSESALPWICENNIVGGPGNNSIITTNGKVWGIVSKAAQTTITGNTVRGLSASGKIEPERGTLEGISVESDGNQSISKNTLYNLTGSSDTQKQQVFGILSLGTGIKVIEKNKIYSLRTTPSEFRGSLRGIYVLDGDATLRNNTISMRLTEGSPVTLLAGMLVSSMESNTSVYHNSIFIEGNQVEGTGLIMAFGNENEGRNTTTISNNIFSNIASNQGSVGTAFFISAPGGGASNIVSNHNIYSPGGNVGAINFQPFSDLAAWQQAGYDENSYQQDPGFVSPDGDTPDLHIDPYASSVANANGVDVGVTDDMDGDLRSALSPVDIGADAFDSMVADQIVVTGGTGLSATYPSLTRSNGLFQALNTIDQTGNDLVITVASDVLNESGAFALNEGKWNSLTIMPNGNRILSGASVEGSALITLNGADKVKIDGADGKLLTISNTRVSGSEGTSTIKFVNGATGNVITNARILGSYGGDGVGGNLFFAGDLMTTTGNDDNTVSNNDIGPAGGNLPAFGIVSSGSTIWDDVLFNSGNVISGNNIYDYHHPEYRSAGIFIVGATTGYTITQNRFYQTAKKGISGTQSAIIAGLEGVKGQFIITDNTIGYSDGSGNGKYALEFNSEFAQFIAINLSVEERKATSVQGNTVAGIDLKSTVTEARVPVFAGVYVNAGLAAIGTVKGNTIGSQSENGNISFIGNTGVYSALYGLRSESSSSWIVANNTIGGISASGSGHHSIYGIEHRGNTALGIFADNVIGGSLPNSIDGDFVYGFLNLSSPASFTGNLVRNLHARSGQTFGIYSVSAFSQTVSGNTVHGLVTDVGAYEHSASGISVQTEDYFQRNGRVEAGDVLVEKNLVYDLSALVPDRDGKYVSGITTNGAGIFRNNVVSLDLGTENLLGYHGLHDSKGQAQFYHNSVYIGGSQASAALASAAFYAEREDGAAGIVRNNIFVNNRSNAGAGAKYYAIQVVSEDATFGSSLIDNNIYFTAGTGNVFGIFNNQEAANFEGWKTLINQDANSYFSNPHFIDPGAAAPNLHISPTIPTLVEGKGVDVGVTDDIDGQLRSDFTPTDIGADAGDFVSKDGALPVRLVTFTAEKQENQVMLNWLIAEAVNVSHFEVERSIDAKQWTKKGELAYGDHVIRYYFPDADMTNQGKTLYYRLKMVDLDGTFAYSRIVSVDLNGSLSLSAYPNPATEWINVKMEGLKTWNDISIVKLYDLEGRVVYTSKKLVSGKIDVRHLSAGAYMLSVTHRDGTVRNLKVMIVN